MPPAEPKTLDEQHIKAIRDFQKSSQSNRRCFDCNEMGPQYVCLDFNTFICTTCSGIHREFSHRIKSISMSSFTDAEVSTIVQKGGNDAARKFWLADFDINTQPSSNLNARDRIRNFIRDAYIDRRWVHTEPKKEAPKKATPAKKVAAATPTDFNPFHLPPPSANHQTSVAFGDFSSFNSSSSNQSAPPPAENFADFSQFASATSLDSSPFASTADAFEANFASFDKPAEVDFFAAAPQVPAFPSTPVKAPAPSTASPAFATFASPSANPFGHISTPTKAPATDFFSDFTAPSPAPSTDPFAAFTSPQPSVATPSHPVDPFAAFTSPQPAAADPFASSTPAYASVPFTPPRDPFTAFDAPVSVAHGNPFTASPAQSSTRDPFGFDAPKPVPAADPFNAFDVLFEPVVTPTVQPVAAPVDVWGHPPPANKPSPQAPSPAKTASMQFQFHSNASTQSFASTASFDHVSPPLHPGKPHAYGSKPDVAAVIDPFASLDIGIKAAPRPTPQYGSNPQYSSNQQPMYPTQPFGMPLKTPPVGHSQASSNPFDMF
ncbi:hypothetical protein ACHHYP_00451 [Achlya hypogyna]|uniref:Arf-GAP domain-containing protein n=1 Tax=Achlya hypogyna TaxID=1202772 RepID=A0A1V9ZAY9_ACHHY|nr:hypothetical protein ACHHYP_00451 [Achlya hypogyna]